MRSELAALIVPLESRLIDAVEAIQTNHSRCAIVVTGERVVGVISEGDILRALLQGADVRSPMAPWVKHGFRYLSTEDHEAAFTLMKRHGISLVPVIGESFELRSAITLADILSRVRLEM